MTHALVSAQSTAVAGGTVPRDALSRAVEDTTLLDSRFGDELRTEQRWAGLRAKLEALPDRALSGPTAVYEAYSEAGDLLLDLYEQVRNEAGLTRPPELDVYYVQDTVAEELPEMLLMTGRYVDLLRITTAQAAADDGTQDETEAARAAVTNAGALIAARRAIISPYNDLVANLDGVADTTSSETLTVNLLEQADQLARLVIQVAPATSVLPGKEFAVPLPMATKVNTEIQTAGNELATTLITELESMLDTRIETLRDERRTTLSMFVLGLILTAALIMMFLVTGLVDRFRRSRRKRDRASDGPEGADQVTHDWDPSGRPGPNGPLVTAGAPAGYGSDTHHWRGERSGVPQ